MKASRAVIRSIRALAEVGVRLTKIEDQLNQIYALQLKTHGLLEEAKEAAETSKAVPGTPKVVSTKPSVPLRKRGTKK